MNSEYKISETSKASPDLTDDELSGLLEDIKTNGQLVPIWIQNGEVIDGRKRLSVCQRLGIEPKIITVSDDMDPESVSYSLNILRTHYTPSQRAIYAARRMNLSPKDGTRIKMGVDKSSTFPTANLPQVDISRERAAKEAGVSERLVGEARTIMSKGTEEIIGAVRSGDLTLHSAKHIIESVPQDKQEEAIQKIIAGSDGKTTQSPARILGIWDGTKRLPKKNNVESIERGLDQLENVLTVLEELMEAMNGGDEKTNIAWAARLGKCRTRVTHLIKATKKED